MLATQVYRLKVSLDKLEWGGYRKRGGYYSNQREGMHGDISSLIGVRTSVPPNGEPTSPMSFAERKPRTKRREPIICKGRFGLIANIRKNRFGLVANIRKGRFS